MIPNLLLMFVLFSFSVTSFGQTNSSINKSNLLNYVFSKKWSIGEIPCNSNGGTYTELTDKNNTGEIITMNGKAMSESDQKYKYSFEVTGNNSFTYKLTTYARGNSLMESITKNPDTVVQSYIGRYQLVSPNKLISKGEYKDINMDNLLNEGKVSYDTKIEEAISTLCEGSLIAPIMAPIGQTLSCDPTEALSQKVLKDTGNQAFSFKVSFTAKEAKLIIGKEKFPLKYEGDFGELNDRAGSYRSKNASLHFSYKSKLAIIRENSNVLSAAICK